jgi:predicted nucleotidyltransferase
MTSLVVALALVVIAIVIATMSIQQQQEQTALGQLTEIEIPQYANNQQRNGTEIIPLEAGIKLGIIDLEDNLPDMTVDFYNDTAVDLDITEYSECLKNEGAEHVANLTATANANATFAAAVMDSIDTAEDRKIEGMEYCIGYQHIAQQVLEMFRK